MNPITILIPIVLTITLVVTIVVLKSRRRGVKHSGVFRYSSSKPDIPFELRSAGFTPTFNRRKCDLEHQSSSWQQVMLNCGSILHKNKVTHVYFTHGTFVGEDSFGMTELIEKVVPELSNSARERIRQTTKRSYEQLTKDSGNYIPEYVDLFQQATGNHIDCQRFSWSSGNHHSARLSASINLFQKLYEDLTITKNRNRTILLIGHSHGGQVFALLSHLIYQSPLGTKLVEAWEEHQTQIQDFSKKASILKKHNYAIVTFGTPHRYPWHPNPKFNLLSIVNHRGKNFLAERPLSFWKTSGGDYVQQWGVSGSDTLSTNSSERKLNRKLDTILGAGIDIKYWLSNLNTKMRVGNYGSCYLIDYHDQSRVPNFMKTVFGHACYTRYEFMLHNTQLICEHFFPH